MDRRDRVKAGIGVIGLLLAAVILAWQLGLFSAKPDEQSVLPVLEPGESPQPRGGMMLPPAEKK